MMLYLLGAKAVWQNKVEPAFGNSSEYHCCYSCLHCCISWPYAQLKTSFSLILIHLGSKCFYPFRKGLRSLAVLQYRLENTIFHLKRVNENSATYFHCAVRRPILHLYGTTVYLQHTSFNQPTYCPTDHC